MSCSVIAVESSLGSTGVWSIVTAAVWPLRFWTTPCDIRTTANTRLSGSRMRSSVRTRSTQKLPRLRVPVRVMPRISAITTTMPAAADTKFWTVLPNMLVR